MPVLRRHENPLERLPENTERLQAIEEVPGVQTAILNEDNRGEDVEQKIFSAILFMIYNYSKCLSIDSVFSIIGKMCCYKTSYDITDYERSRPIHRNSFFDATRDRTCQTVTVEMEKVCWNGMSHK